MENPNRHGFQLVFNNPETKKKKTTVRLIKSE